MFPFLENVLEAVEENQRKEHEMSSKAVVSQLVEAWNADDMVRFYDCFAEQCVFHSLEDFGLPPTLAGYRQIISAFVAGFSERRMTLLELVAQDERVAVLVREEGRHTGPWQGIAPTNKRVQFEEAAFYRLAHGKIVEWRLVANPAQLLHQLHS